MPTPDPIRILATITDHNLIPITLQGAGAITTQEEAMVHLDHRIRVVGVPPVTVQDPEAPAVEAEAALEVDNIELKFNDYEKVHPSCSHVTFIPIGNLCAVHG